MTSSTIELAHILAGLKEAERHCHACNFHFIVLAVIPPEQSGLMMTTHKPLSASEDVTECQRCRMPLTDRPTIKTVSTVANGHPVDAPRRGRRPKALLAPPKKLIPTIKPTRKSAKTANDAPGTWHPKLPGIKYNGDLRAGFAPYGNRLRKLDDGMYEWTQDYGNKVVIDPNEEIGAESLVKNYLGYSWRLILAHARQIAVLKYRKEQLGKQTRFWIKGLDLVDLLKEIDRIGAEMQNANQPTKTED